MSYFNKGNEMSYEKSYGSNQLGTTPVGAPAVPRLHSLGERFERSLSEFQNLNTMLRQIAERTLGAIPENVSKDAQGPGPASVAKLEIYHEALDGMLSRLRETINRLESL